MKDVVFYFILIVFLVAGWFAVSHFGSFLDEVFKSNCEKMKEMQEATLTDGEERTEQDEKDFL